MAWGFPSIRNAVGLAPAQCSRLLRIAPEAGMIASGQVIATLGSVASIRILTGVLSPSGYGTLALCLTAASLTQQLLLGPVGMAAIRYFAPAAEGNYIRSYVRATAALTAGSTVLLLFLAGLVRWYLGFAGYQEWTGVFWAAFAFALLSSVNALIDGMQNAARQRAIVALHQGTGAWLRLGLVLAVVRIWAASSAAVLWAQSAGYFLIILSQTAFLYRTLVRSGLKAESKESTSIHQAMWRYAWPFSTWGVFTWLQTASDRWALNVYSGVGQVGLYQSLYQLGFYPITLLTQLVVQVATPIIFHRAGGGMDQDRQRSALRLNNALLGTTLFVTVIATLASYAGGHRILAYIVAPAYRGSSPLITPLILAGGLFAAGQIGCLNLMTALSTQRLIAPKIGSAVLGTGLNCVGAMVWGTPGVIAAQVGFTSIFLAWILWLMNRKPAADVSLPVSDPMKQVEA